MLIKSDQYDNLYFNAIIVGRYKTGKTECLWTYRDLLAKLHMKARKLYVYDFDMGAAPLIRRAREGNWLADLRIFRYAREGGSKIATGLATAHPKDPIIDFMKDINNLYDWVDPSTGYWRDEYVNEAPAVLLVDSLTSFGDAMLEFTVANLGHELGAPGTHGGSDYGKQMAKIVECIKATRELPCISIWTAHETVEAEAIGQPGQLEQQKPMITGERFYVPVVTGNLKFTIGALFDIVVHTRVQGDEYRWIVKPAGEVRGAGSRLRGKFATGQIGQNLAQLIG